MTRKSSGATHASATATTTAQMPTVGTSTAPPPTSHGCRRPHGRSEGCGTASLPSDNREHASARPSCSFCPSNQLQAHGTTAPWFIRTLLERAKTRLSGTPTTQATTTTENRQDATTRRAPPRWWNGGLYHARHRRQARHRVSRGSAPSRRSRERSARAAAVNCASPRAPNPPHRCSYCPSRGPQAPPATRRRSANRLHRSLRTEQLRVPGRGVPH